MLFLMILVSYFSSNDFNIFIEGVHYVALYKHNYTKHHIEDKLLILCVQWKFLNIWTWFSSWVFCISFQVRNTTTHFFGSLTCAQTSTFTLAVVLPFPGREWIINWTSYGFFHSIVPLYAQHFHYLLWRWWRYRAFHT